MYNDLAAAEKAHCSVLEVSLKAKCKHHSDVKYTAVLGSVKSE